MRFNATMREITPYTVKGILAHIASALYSIAIALDHVAQAIREHRG